MTMTNRGPLPVVLALGAHDIVDLLGHQLLQDTEPNADAQREQPLLRDPDQLPQRILDALREHDLLTGRLSDRYVAFHVLHLAELVMPRRRVTVVQDDSINARPALLNAEKDAGVLCTQALQLAPHIVTGDHQRRSLLHDRCV
jgi:hypothetical protein